MFIETITAFGNDVLVPINRIKFINFSFTNEYTIKITSDDGSWEECFDNDFEKANARYKMVKEIIKAK